MSNKLQSQYATKGLLDLYVPPTTDSTNWKHWIATLDTNTCVECRNKHGTIYALTDILFPEPPLHMRCRCVIKAMQAVIAGRSTREGINGADWWIKNYNCLPDYYISVQELLSLGWKWGKSPEKYAPGKMVTMGIYRNENGHLPVAFGRVWYEADLNYYTGRRNAQRLLWSNDGLIFVTYDHYRTFIEVV